MASRVEVFTATCPAETPIATPVIIPTEFVIGQVDIIEIVVPPGPSGLMGFGIRHGGASVFPREDDRWIIADNEPIKWNVESVPTAGQWSVRMYNLDVFDHSIYLRYLVKEVGGVNLLVAPALEIFQADQVSPAVEELMPPGIEEVA